MRTSLLGLFVACLCAGESVVVLPAPNRLELYLDGARLAHSVPVPAGRSRVPLPPGIGDIVTVDGADAWVVENRIDSSEPPAMPLLLIELATIKAKLDREESILAGQEEAAERVAAEVGLRLGQRGVVPGDETTEWQAALDGMLSLRGGIATSRLAQAAAWRDLRERAAAEAAPGISYAAALGLDGGQPANDLGDPAANARRAWSIAVERSALSRTLVVERAAAGAVIVVTGRDDMRWEPRARLVVVKGSATLVRQAAVQVPAGLVLPTAPARLVGGGRAQPLAGAALVPRAVTAGDAPVAERRSVTTTTRAAGWAGEGATAAAREQSWELAALTLAAPGQNAVEVMAELQKGGVALAADEWVLAPDLAPVLVRRLSVRLDAQPLAAGTLELVVDGTVLGRRNLPATPSGALIHLAAGEDQRVFLAETKRWDEDPNRPVNRKREGGDYRLRNLSADKVSFACYLARPVSAAKGVTITTDPATTAGWKPAQPGILRWELTLKPGEELTVHNGWTVEAEGRIRL